jgi:hypothetical protein
MIVAATVGRMDIAQQILNRKAYFRPHHGMLQLADAELRPTPPLTDLARAKPVLGPTDALEATEYSLN